MSKIRRALLSVSDKTNLVELARGLRELGVELLSSGGTGALLDREGIPVQSVSDATGFPEILDGRVKTLHPRIFGGILARDTPEHRAQLQAQDIVAIDLVVVNLYPFSETLRNETSTPQQIIEKIDIGGPSMVRAAAKNFERVAVVVDPSDYESLLAALRDGDGGLTEETRRQYAAKAFAHTAEYDATIANYFQLSMDEAGDKMAELPEVISLQLKKIQDLRYGENPHQGAAFYKVSGYAGNDISKQYEKLQGKALSYNNIVDVDAAWAVVRDLPQTAVAVIKHTNPCGAACEVGGDPAAVFRRAKATDPLSSFGGIVAVNQPVTEALAAELSEMFLEVVVAPDFEAAALAKLARKKNLRLLRWKDSAALPFQLRSTAGGFLAQRWDQAVEDLKRAEVATKRAPTEAELRDLAFAWVICKHVKSNAIVYAKAGQLLGVGAGQMSRVDSVKIAAMKAQLPLHGAVMASDAFFPFRDGLDEAASVGISAVVQPGGSIRDAEVIAAADEHGVAMIHTGVRHFKH